MTYSLDLRQRAVAFARGGASQKQTCEIFGISRDTLYRWMRAESLLPKKVLTRKRKLDRSALLIHVRQNKSALLRERAAHFGVSINAIHFALKKMKITKKNDTAL